MPLEPLPRVLQKVRAVLQSTLQQLHKVQNMLDTLQNKLLDSMRHLQNQLPDKLQTVLQNTFHQRHELRNVLRQVRKKIRNKLRVVLQSTLRQLHKLQSMLHTLRSKFLNILHKLQNKLPNQLRVVLQSTLHQVHKLQNMLYQLHQYFWICRNLQRFELGNVRPPRGSCTGRPEKPSTILRMLTMQVRYVWRTCFRGGVM